MGSSALLLLKLALLAAAYTLQPPAAAAADVDCDRKCGEVDISFPFGMKKGCFKDPDFQIICESSSSSEHIPYLASGTDNTLQVVYISLNSSEIHVSMPVSQACYDRKGDNTTLSFFTSRRFFVPPKFSISSKKNKFYVVGSDAFAYLYDRKAKRLHGCETTGCSDQRSAATNNSGSCFGDDFCHSDFEQALTNYSITVSVSFDSPDAPEELRCGFAFLAQNGSLDFSEDDVKKVRKSNRSTVVLDWAVDQRSSCGGACKGNKTECTESQSVTGSYYCACKQGFEGNPYMNEGCEDVDECSSLNNCLHKNLCENTEGDYRCYCPSGQKGNGRNETGLGSGCNTPNNHIMTIPLVVTIAVLVVIALVSILFWIRKQRAVKQLRQIYFEQNGGN